MLLYYIPTLTFQKTTLLLIFWAVRVKDKFSAQLDIVGLLVLYLKGTPFLITLCLVLRFRWLNSDINKLTGVAEWLMYWRDFFKHQCLKYLFGRAY